VKVLIFTGSYHGLYASLRDYPLGRLELGILRISLFMENLKSNSYPHRAVHVKSKPKGVSDLHGILLVMETVYLTFSES
jgi:hypothetical protein